ncbi:MULTISPECIES: GlcG/HbpS family heme-binding protein [Alicyclobacillus]|uniref:Heme-binding protein n=1 Tax=Alicyclobacillus acidoterrestris (strain ATCC 49025 / DSM 3922 / CIP 106132 / NCIMB 13137 / GD3B) TaxID=1356854 RepID=T0CNL8_ALIAG|nr:MULTISPECIES: heme-binding protein [Alicyclobacillus]EPZ41037.1 hypothetical protein N007_17580 [Alicyclobacillus acidoterrestris ATCC 49025]UNO47799.1 heme-binding protein [Alicyclobacillus acidoterrestris]GEO27197.1 hypothetical protein AAC03nite_29820 [Alicyclobacillus acidoterrestris]
MNVYFHKPAISQPIVVKMLEAACACAQDLGTSVNVAIVDDGGNLKGFIRMDDAPLLSGEIAQNKAYSASAFGMPTSQWYPMLEKNPALLHGIVHTNRLTIFAGGLPILIEGRVAGGIGVSGGTGEQDELCAKAGLAELETYLRS